MADADFILEVEGIEDLPGVEGQLKKRLSQKVKAIFAALAQRVKARMRDIVAARLASDPTLQSVLRGRLRAELGLASPDGPVAALIQAVVNGIDVQVKPGPDGYPSVVVTLFRADFYKPLLAIPGTAYVSQTARGGTLVPWLYWLFYAGTSKVVGDAEVKDYKRAITSSRTGTTLMARPTSRGPMGYAVPPEHAGTPGDNFLTRALDSALPMVENELVAAIEAFRDGGE